MVHFLKKKSFRYGIPFFILVLGGPLGLQQFQNLRFQYKTSSVDPATFRKEIEKMGISLKKPGEVTLESEYRKMKNVDLDNWENKRIPRPWEE